MEDDFLNDEDRAFLGVGKSVPKQAPTRSGGMWGHFIDALKEGAVHSGLGAEPIARQRLKNQGYTAEQINEGEKRLIKGIETRRRQRDEQFKDVDTLSPANIGKWTVDLAGNLIGGVDPTYPVSLGRNALARVLSQAGINFGVDALSQGQEVRRKIKKGYDPRQGALAAGGGAALQGAGEVVGRTRANRAIARGSDGTDLGLAKGIGEKFGRVTSTIRTPEHNKKVGGVPNSWHVRGRAIDIARGKGVTHKQIENAYRKAGFRVIESLDEGDHSHLAFDFGKKSGPSTPVLAAERSTTTHADIEDMLTPSAKARIQEMVDQDPELARILLGEQVKTSQETAIEQAPNVTDISDRFISPEVRETMKPVYDDVLTPAERQEMDAGVAKAPEIRGALSEDILDSFIGKGTVATTPVNDFMPQTPYDLRLQTLLDTPENKIEAERLWTEAHERAINKYRVPDDYVSAQMKQAGKSGRKFHATQEQMDEVLASADEAVIGFWEKKLQLAKDLLDDESGSFNPFGSKRTPKGSVGATPPTPELVKLTEALKAAKKAGPEQRKLRKAEKKARVAEAMKRSRFTEGESGIHAEKAALKGELPRVDIEPLRPHLTPDEQKALLKTFKDSRKLSYFESLNVRDALVGMFDGKLPTKSEMSLMYRVHPDLVKAILGKRSWPEKAKEYLLRAFETSRAQMGSGDVSFGGRQGLSMISRPEYWKSTLGEFKALSPTRGDEVIAEQTERIVNSPHYERAKQADLHLMDLGADREEYAPHGLIEDLPIIGEIPKASNRAYTFMANELRFSTFSNFLDRAEKAGKDIDDPAFLKAAGEWVNTFTGRGQFGKGPIGKKLNAMLPGASLFLFAPRFVLSTFQRLNPLFWGRMAMQPYVAKEALRDAGAHVAFVAGALGIASQAGYEVEWDPRNPTGLKIKKGNVTRDVGGGMVQTINFLSKMLTDEKITGKGEKQSLRDPEYGGDNNWDTAMRFLRTKLHPTIGYLVNAKEGENVVGREFEGLKDTFELLTPMYGNTVVESMKENFKANPEESIFDVIGALFGMGLSNYKPVEKEAKPMSDEEFLGGSTKEPENDNELSAEDKVFLGL